VLLTIDGKPVDDAAAPPATRAVDDAIRCGPCEGRVTFVMNRGAPETPPRGNATRWPPSLTGVTV
jgi:hypothetical protein